MSNEKKLIAGFIRKYGAVIDMSRSPETMIDIIRRIRLIDDGGLPPGGVPEPPPGPTSFQDRITNDDIMKALLQLTRQVKALTAAQNATVAKTSATRPGAVAKKRSK